jgi:hypothetical protein
MYYHIPTDDILSVISKLNVIHHQSTTPITTTDNPTNVVTLSAALELSDEVRVRVISDFS